MATQTVTQFFWSELFPDNMIAATPTSTPTGVIDHETCADNFLYLPKLVLRLRIIYVILTIVV